MAFGWLVLTLHMRAVQEFLCLVLRKRSRQKPRNSVLFANGKKFSVSIVKATATETTAARRELDCVRVRAACEAELVDPFGGYSGSIHQLRSIFADCAVD
jgi:hypothetical protein